MSPSAKSLLLSRPKAHSHLVIIYGGNSMFVIRSLSMYNNNEQIRNTIVVYA